MRLSGLILLLFLLACRFPVVAQAIKGEVVDEARQPLSGVSIENIHTALDIQSGNEGAFIIAATGGQLLEFKKQGYKTTRVRIPMGYMPSYFRIIMMKGVTEIKKDAIAGRYDYKSDSLRYNELYKNILDFPKMSAIQTISHPFTAMSRVNQQKWHFQDVYVDFQQEKYVDMTFNPDIITKVTGLTGDSLQSYMRRFRPSYQQLRMMNEYTFFTYIKNTVRSYRTPDRPRGSQ